MSSFFRGLEERKISRLFVYFSPLKSSFFCGGEQLETGLGRKGVGLGQALILPKATPYFLVRALCLQAFLSPSSPVR